MNTVKIVHHPLIADSLFHLRNGKTGLQAFRHYSDRICRFILAESIRELPLEKEEVETPLTKTRESVMRSEVVIIPVLRAGIAMLFTALELFPKAKIGFVGLERDENTAVASQYYWKIPVISSKTTVVVTDPMLATGGSLVHILQKITPLKPERIIAVSVIAAPEGIEIIQKQFPDVKIYTASIDEKLNGKKYIVPGLGDYGDRYFGTV